MRTLKPILEQLVKIVETARATEVKELVVHVGNPINE